MKFNGPKTTVAEKEFWLLGCPSKWNRLLEMTHAERLEALDALFNDMKERGFYSQWTTKVDGRISLQTMIERLIARGCGDGIHV